MKSNVEMIRSSLVALAIGAASVGAHAASVQVLAPGSPVTAGDSFTVSLFGYDFASLDGGGADLSFSPALLELTSVQVDPSWDFFSLPGEIDNATGHLTGMSFNVWGAKQGDFAIASLQFTAKASGLAAIDLFGSDMFPFGSGGVEVNVALIGAQVQINSPVPEPGTWLLMLGGLGLLGARASRRTTARD